MIKSGKQHDAEQVERFIDLRGPEGNAFVLIGKATSLAKQIGLDGSAIQAEMMSGDYDNLVAVFDKHFGSFFTLIR